MVKRKPIEEHSHYSNQLPADVRAHNYLDKTCTQKMQLCQERRLENRNERSSINVLISPYHFEIANQQGDRGVGINFYG